VRYIQWAEDQRVEYAEGDRVRVNYDGEGQNGGEGEGRGFAQHAESSANPEVRSPFSATLRVLGIRRFHSWRSQTTKNGMEAMSLKIQHLVGEHNMFRLATTH
jgi:hypothetical protein